MAANAVITIVAAISGSTTRPETRSRSSVISASVIECPTVNAVTSHASRIHSRGPYAAVSAATNRMWSVARQSAMWWKPSWR